jgi:hypothetical protein
MAVPTYGLRGRRNAAFVLPVTFTTAGEPMDLTGYEMQMQIRTKPGQGEALVSLVHREDDGQGIVILDAENGLTKVFILESTLYGLPIASPAPTETTFYYDLRTRPTGSYWTVHMQGQFIVDTGVTR